jgi:hypothetical protein
MTEKDNVRTLGLSPDEEEANRVAKQECIRMLDEACSVFLVIQNAAGKHEFLGFGKTDPIPMLGAIEASKFSFVKSTGVAHGK